jgi:flagellar assembly protein FliH
MSDRRERIPAAEVPDPKLWKLPFWTEPKHIVHVEETEAEEDDSEVLIEDEEIEVEPLTIEQLETIRQEAYNEGLEQGLVEGRQKGEKQGYDDGHVEGLAAGKTEGNKLGYDTGLEKGEKKALAEGDDKSAQLTSRIQANMRNIEKVVNEQKSAIEKILPDLVISLAEVVISEELDQGSEHIVSLVNNAINALPIDTNGLTVECNALDLPFLEAAQEQTDFDAKFKMSEKIQPGGCKVSSKYSSIDFTLSERWESVVKQYRQQLQLGFSQLDDIQKDQAEEDQQVAERIAQEADKKEEQLKDINASTLEAKSENQDQPNNDIESVVSEDIDNTQLPEQTLTDKGAEQESSDQLDTSAETLESLTPDTSIDQPDVNQSIETKESHKTTEVDDLSDSKEDNSELDLASTDEPLIDETAVGESVVDESIVDESVVDESVVDESAVDESVVDESTAKESTGDESVADESVVDESDKKVEQKNTGTPDDENELGGDHE